jgi:hypothetical protein
VNDTLRAGLTRSTDEAEEPPYTTPVSDLGKHVLVGIHSVHDMLARAEGEDFR